MFRLEVLTMFRSFGQWKINFNEKKFLTNAIQIELGMGAKKQITIRWNFQKVIQNIELIDQKPYRKIFSF